jgi:hypothetical protein
MGFLLRAAGNPGRRVAGLPPSPDTLAPKRRESLDFWGLEESGDGERQTYQKPTFIIAQLYLRTLFIPNSVSLEGSNGGKK